MPRLSGPSSTLIKINKLLAYVLGRRPDEFGLLPDDEGYIKIKPLFQALAEIDGFRHIRPAHLREIMLAALKPSFELHDDLIRARDLSTLPHPVTCASLPKLLYTAVRARAHAHVLKNGVAPTVYPFVLSADDPSLALRLGHRTDPAPVLLTIQSAAAISLGVHFKQFGEALYISNALPAGAFSAPPLPPPKAPLHKAKTEIKPVAPHEYGSFILDGYVDPEVKKADRRRKNQREMERRKAYRQVRERKERGE